MTIEARSATVAIPESGQEAVMNVASGSHVTGGMLFLLAGLAALGALANRGSRATPFDALCTD